MSREPDEHSYTSLHEANSVSLRGQALFSLRDSNIPPTTTSLNLDLNEFCDFPQLLLKLTSLERLSMCSQVKPNRASFNQWPALSIIPMGISTLSRLRELELSNNAIQFLPEDFNRLTNLHKLNLTLNWLKLFPIVVCDLPALEKLYLSGNYISQLPPDVGKMRQLKELRIANNKLTSICEEIVQLNNLNVLSLRNNQITILPRSMSYMSVMHDIDSHGYGVLLEGNPLENSPKHLVEKSISEAMAHLGRQTQDLRRPPASPGIRPETGIPFHGESNAPTKDFNPWYENVGELQPGKLGLSKNVPPLTVLNERSLQGHVGEIPHLDASHNKIETVKPFQQLSSLQRLILDTNCLRTLPAEVLSMLKDLQLLSMQNQHDKEYGTHQQRSCILREIPDHLFLCKNLRELYLGQNRIEKLDEIMGNLPELEVMDLVDNHLHTISENVLSKLPRLKYLGISLNNIRQLPNDVGCLKSLEVLRLSNNQLSVLPQSIVELPKLITFTLSQNRLVGLPLGFYKLRGLLPSNSTYKNEHLKREYFPSLYLDGNDIKYPKPCFLKKNKDGLIDVQHLFEYMESVEKNPGAFERVTADLRSCGIDLATGSLTFHSLTDKVLAAISKGIGREGMQLGIQLGFSTAELDQLDQDNISAMDRYCKMLIKWRDRNIGIQSENDLLSELANAFAAVGRRDIQQNLQGLPIN